MPEEQLFETEDVQSREAIAQTLAAAAARVESGTVSLESATREDSVSLPDEPTFEDAASLGAGTLRSRL